MYVVGPHGKLNKCCVVVVRLGEDGAFSVTELVELVESVESASVVLVSVIIDDINNGELGESHCE